MKTEVHLRKYRKFKEEIERAKYVPAKIQNMFISCFHLIEACCYFKSGVHIQKHQNIRRVLEANSEIFGDNTRRVWTLFRELDNELRSVTAYGGPEDGKKLRKAMKIFKQIEKLCGDVLDSG